MNTKQFWQSSKLINLHKLFKPQTINKGLENYHKLLSKTIDTYEKQYPVIKTTIPGPKTQSQQLRYKQITGVSNSIPDVINMESSFGNYYDDLDGNSFLDMHQDHGRNVLGYNHRNMLRYSKLDHFQLNSINNSSSTSNVDYVSSLLDKLSNLAPYEVTDVILSSNEETAIDDAVNLACLNKGKNGNITFDGGLYQNSNSIQVEFPNIQHPYDMNYNTNQAEEERILSSVEKTIKENIEKVSTLIIEPIQYFGGVRHCSVTFYKKLQKICASNDITFIVDETYTSGWVTGRMLASSSWNLDVGNSPDIIVFGGRTQISGFYHKREIRNIDNRINNYVPEVFKMQKFEKLVDLVYKIDWLDQHSSNFYSSMIGEFNEIVKKMNFNIYSFRGVGKMFAFDVDHEILRDEIVYLAQLNGFRITPLNKTTIAFTPCLLFTEVHFTHFKNFLINLKVSTAYMSKI